MDKVCRFLIVYFTFFKNRQYDAPPACLCRAQFPRILKKMLMVFQLAGNIFQEIKNHLSAVAQLVS